MRSFIAPIHKAASSDFGVMALEALALHLEAMREDGAANPPPASLKEFMATRTNRDGVAIVVDAPPASSKSVRVNITLADEMLANIDRHATANGLTRSGFLARAAQRELAL